MFYIWNGIKFILVLVLSIVVLVGFVIWDVIQFVGLTIWKLFKTVAQFIIGFVEIIWHILLCGLYDSVASIISFLYDYTQKVNSQFEIRYMKKKRQKMKEQRKELKNEIEKIEMKSAKQEI